MGFCIYCNKNVFNSTTCPKCYRTVPVSNTSSNKSDTLSSRVTALFPEERRLKQKSNTDRWQDTYSKKAIFNDGVSSAAPIRTRQQRVMPQFTTSTSTNNLQFDNTKKCMTCQGVPWAMDELNDFARVCEPCRMIGRVLPSPAPESSSVSTPVLSSLATSRSSLTSSSSTKSNPYFEFQRSRRASMLNRANHNFSDDFSSSSGPSPTTTVSTSAIVTSPISTSPPRSPPPLLNRISEEGSIYKNTSALYRRAATASPPPSPPQHQPVAPVVEPIIEPKKTESAPRKRRVVKKPCKECGQHVSKKDYRGLKIHTGEVLIFHSFCLFCAKCHQNFHGLEFCTDGKNFYHTECPAVIAEHPTSEVRHGSPLSEEEDPYPQTPPPASHDTQFDIASSSPTDTVSSSHFDSELPKKQHVIVPDDTTITNIMCHTCTLPLTDSTCLELANHFYHKECLLCAGCNKTVPTDRKLSKYGDKLYCDHCTPKKSNSTTTTTTTTTSKAPNAGLRIQVDTTLPKRVPTITTPSDIFKSRKKVLPRLGGVRTCARCNESMPFSDTQPGPSASRWHKKCLRCTGCKKQMDSDAHMTVNEETGLCLVHCRECLDETPKSRFVR